MIHVEFKNLVIFQILFHPKIMSKNTIVYLLIPLELNSFFRNYF